MRPLRIVGVTALALLLAALYAPASVVGTWQSDTGQMRWVITIAPHGVMRGVLMDRSTGDYRAYSGGWRIDSAKRAFCWYSPEMERCMPYRVGADSLTIGKRHYVRIQTSAVNDAN